MAHRNSSARKYENIFNLSSFCLCNIVLSGPEAKCQPTEALEVGNPNSCCTRVCEANTHVDASCVPSSYPPPSCRTHYSLALKGWEISPGRWDLCKKEMTGYGDWWRRNVRQACVQFSALLCKPSGCVVCLLIHTDLPGRIKSNKAFESPIHSPWHTGDAQWTAVSILFHRGFSGLLLL